MIKDRKAAGYIRNIKQGQELNVIESSDDRKEKIARKYKVTAAHCIDSRFIWDQEML